MKRSFLFFSASVSMACSGVDSSIADAAGDGSSSDGSSQDSTMQSDGSSDATYDGTNPNDGSAGGDSGSNPGLIDCAGLQCVVGQNICCAEQIDGGSSFTRTCKSSQSCNGPQAACDEKADCPNNELCCFNQTNQATLARRCAASCGASIQVCKTSQECVMGTCATYTCPILGVVQACAKPMGCN